MPIRVKSAFRSIRWGTLARVYRRFLPYILRYRVDLAGAGLSLVASIGMILLLPWPLKIVFDYVLHVGQDSPRSLPPYLAWALPADPIHLLMVACAGVIGIALLTGLFSYWQNFLAAKVAHRAITRIRGDLFAHVQRLPIAFHHRHPTGDLLMRMTGDVQMLREILLTSVITMVSRLLAVLGMVLVMSLMSWRLTLIALGVIPLLSLLLFRFSGRLREVTHRQRRKEGRLATIINETIQSISVVQSFSRESFEDERLAKLNRSSSRAGLQGTRLQEGMSRSAGLIVALGTTGVLAAGTVMTLRGGITPGDLLVFLTYVRGLYKPLRAVSRLVARLSKASVCAERILDLFEFESPIADAPDAIEAPAFSGAVEFRNVSLRYDDRTVPALDGVDLRIQPGETVLLVGPSGAGKSSIASLLLRLYDPTSGTIRIDGIDIRRFRIESFRTQIAVVLQESILFGTSIRENIAYGKPDATMDEIIAAARRVNAHEFIDRLPDRYDTMISERGVTLSGGERQRIALARAAIKKAPLLILDEPTTGLDAASEKAVLKGMRSLLDECTAFVISHRPELFPEADRIILLKEGKIVRESIDGIRQDLAQGRA